MKNTQNSQNFHKENIQLLRLDFCEADRKNEELLEYLQKEYPPGSKKINLGSIYQIPIEAKGVELLTKYWFWDIEMINLTYHKIQNQGLQHLIQRGLSSFLQTSKYHQKWTQLTQLSIIKNNLTSQGFQGIEDLHLQNLKVLRASNNRIDHFAIYKFVQSHWPNLVQLEFANNKIGKQGCKILMMSKWKHFKRLDLNYNLIENQGTHYLSEADWPELTQINLSNNKLDASATFYLKNANWPNLKSLLLNKNKIGKSTFGLYLSEIKMQQCRMSKLMSSQVQFLRKTFIVQLFSHQDGNQITLNGILIILQSKKLVGGCFLELSRNHFRFQDIKDSLKHYDKFCNQFEN